MEHDPNSNIPPLKLDEKEQQAPPASGYIPGEDNIAHAGDLYPENAQPLQIPNMEVERESHTSNSYTAGEDSKLERGGSQPNYYVPHAARTTAEGDEDGAASEHTAQPPEHQQAA